MKKILVSALLLCASLQGCAQIWRIFSNSGQTIVVNSDSDSTIKVKDTTGYVAPTMVVVATQPQSQSIYQGDNVTVSASFAGGVSPYTITRIVNSAAISGNSNSYSLAVSAPSTTVQFRCVDAIGQVALSSVATITRINTLVISTQPVSAAVDSGATASYSIAVNGGALPITYQWKFNGANVGMNASVLTLTGYYVSGNVQCTAVDAAGHNVVSDVVRLDFTGGSGSAQHLSFSFTTIGDSTATSAGVYKIVGSDTILVRTLWGNVNYSAGVHSSVWDGKDNYGQYIANQAYLIIVQKNKVTPIWSGTIFNNSKYISGASKYHGTQASGIENLGHKIFFFHSYCENNYFLDLSTIESPHEKVSLGGLVSGTNFGSTNNGKKYAYGLVNSDGVNWYVYAYDTTGTAVTFTSTGSTTMFSVPAQIIDISAQKNGGDLFFASIPSQNKIKVFNSLTGALLKDISFTNPGHIACDYANNIWINDTKYHINSDTTLSSTGITYTGVYVNYKMSVSPDNQTLTVLDGDLSQNNLKSFSNITGAASWTLGQVGGYAHTTIVSNDRFAFHIAAQDAQTTTIPFVNYFADGSFWINDAYSYRDMHFDASRNYLEQIAFLPATYSGFVDPNSPTHFYTQLIRCTVTNMYDPQHSWVLDRQYGGMAPSNTQTFAQFSTVTTVPYNNRTYAVLNQVGTLNQLLVDITDSFRITPTTLTNDGNIFQSDGSIWTRPIYGASHQAVTGIMGNDLLYGAGIPWIGFNVPISDTLPLTIPNVPLFPNGDLATFNETNSNGWHLGLIAHNGTSFKMLGAHSTGGAYQGDYSKDGFFNNGSGTNYPGGQISISGWYGYWNHHGEFFKSGQTSYHTLFDRFLLTIGVWGTEQDDEHPQGECAAWNSGNAKFSRIFQYDGKWWLVFNDESRHGGLHIVCLGNIDANISYEFINVTKVDNTPPVTNYIDLMQGLPYQTGIGGASYGLWSVDSTNDDFRAQTGYLSYGMTTQDLYVYGYNINKKVSRLLPVVDGNYEITGSIAMRSQIAIGMFTPSNSLHLCLYDSLNKKIADISNVNNRWGVYGDPHNFTINGTTVVQDATLKAFRPLNSFDLMTVSGNLQFSYLGHTVTVPIADNTADITKPAKLTVEFSDGGDHYSGAGMDIDLKDLRLIKH